MTTTIHSTLQIRRLELYVYLGWLDNERQEKQVVHLDVDIEFKHPPKACVTDKLDDTQCYSALITTIQEKIAAKNFHLIEHLAHDIYHIIKTALADQSTIAVRIIKHPKIEGLTNGVCFEYRGES